MSIIHSIHSLRCDHDGCSETVQVIADDNEINWDALADSIENAGWYHDDPDNQYCPVHAAERRQEAAEDARMPQIDAEMDDPRRGQAADINRRYGA